MSAYSPEEQAAYDVGFKIGKSLGATGVEFNAISKKKWTSAYRHQIDELIKENEQLREQLAAEREKAQLLVDALKEALNELGVPNEGYPAPVANAVDILNAALAKVGK